MPSKTSAHTTKHEIKFIERLGKHSDESNVVREIPVGELLRRYIAACKKRADWGEMDRDEVIQYAENLMGMG